MAEQKLAIELIDVTVQFPRTENAGGPDNANGAGSNEETLLHKINLQIPQAESFVLIGPSGQGKSVLMKVMAGLIPPTKGRVLIDGYDLAKISEKERRQLIRKMGMLFQKNALFDSMTVGENVSFPMLEVGRSSDKEANDAIQYYLEAVGILHAKDLYPDEISGGMQKRLGIARALALKPQIIFYDDPTAGLDPITSRKIVELILLLKRDRGSTIVSVTNDMSRAYQMADRIGVVVEKELIVTGNQQQTLAHSDPRVHQFVRGLLAGPLTVSA